MKSVAIVGAGPGGLVAAKILLHSYPAKTFSVTIFEKSDNIGGLWNVKKHPTDGFLPPNMPTNLSKYTVGFSDLSWDSMKFNNKSAPTFPKAWQAQEYLEEYANRYIPREAILLGSEVKFADTFLQDSKPAWTIKYSSTGKSGVHEKSFDYLMVATGFFAQPRSIQCKLDGFRQDSSPVKLVHSSKYRALGDAVPEKSVGKGKKILVIGGANSGGEAAAAIASDISSRRHSPNGDEDLDYQIIHITPRPVYGLPLFVPGDVPGTFLPLDLKFYELSKRPEETISFAFSKQPPEMSRFVHGLMQSMLGTDKYELGFQPLLGDDAADVAAPYAAIQESYAGYVRSGLIDHKLGRVTSLAEGSGKDTLTAQVQFGSEQFLVEDVAGVVYATGYTPAPALEILSESVREKLGYDSQNLRLPVLTCDDAVSSHPSVPHLGLIGFYEGPYWGVMEMQARLLARKWATSDGTSERSEESIKREQNLRDLRDAMRSDKPRVPQYIFSDYLAILEHSARDLGLARNDNGWEPRQGPVTYARYLDDGSSKGEAQRTMLSIKDFQKSAEAGRLAPRATMRGLQGPWKMQRKLQSVIADYPSGTLTGTASFHPRAPTDPEYDLEYLYVEKGSLVTEQGLSMNTHRKYVYRYREDKDQLSVWFVKQDGKTCDYLYHELEFQARDPEPQEASWRAKGDHLCEADFYSSQYGFHFNGVALKNFTVKHAVKGPKKDYTSETLYEHQDGE
ncbi:hypothetical protein MMC10_006860 [Thelotrema lepadinum]|nr:hypothetical protein [Thelotrema lepadinum]